MAKVAEYIIQRLADAGISRAFLVYGGAIADLVDALPGRMEYTVMQHEQACCFAAEGWAKVTGKPGLVIATSGPGGQNIVTGLCNAFYDSTPLIALTGQVSTQFMRPEGSSLRQLGFQECPIVEMVRPITKYAAQPRTGPEAAWWLENALHAAQTGRKGPALLDLSTDVQRLPLPDCFACNPPATPPTYDPGEYPAMFLRDLAASRRPAILVGGGAYAARQQIMAFAVARCLPVFRTWNALDVAPDNHPCFAGTIGTYGGAGRNFGVQNADLLLVLGCRLSGRITGGVPESFARGAKLYVVDVDPALLDPANQPRKADVNVLCDAGKFIETLWGL